MNERRTKKPLQSKSIWGGIIALVSGVAQILTENATDIPVLGEAAPIVTVAGSLLALIGRIFATKEISFK